MRKRAKRLEEIPRVRPRGLLLDVHIRDDREADEQRLLVRLVVRELDANRQALDDFHEVARGVLWRQQREGLPRTHREAGDAPLQVTTIAVHVDLASHALADA